VLARIASITSKPNSPNLLRPTKKSTILFGQNMSVESVRTSENVEYVFDKAIFRFSHRLDKVDMAKFFLRRRRTLEKFVH